MENIETSIAIHPKEFLKDLLVSFDMTQKDLAARIGVSEKMITGIIKNGDRITPDTAMKLEKIFETPATFWIGAQSRYDAYVKRIEEDSALEGSQSEAYKKKGINKIYKQLVKNGVLEPSKSLIDEIRSMMAFFGVSDLNLLDKVYKQQLGMAWKPSVKFSTYDFIAWLRCGEKKFRETSLPAYDREKFSLAVQNVRQLADKNIEYAWAQIEKEYAASGVFAVHTPCLNASRAYGFTEWIGDNAVIHLSFRGSNDAKWHALFHESGHVLQGKKSKLFVNMDCFANETDPDEVVAHNFALDTLIPKRSEFKRFLEESKFTEKTIKCHADLQKVHPGIIVAQLQRNGRLKWDSKLNSLKK